METLKKAKYLLVATIIIILAFTVLEFPAPVGFEVRPQDNVSMYWLIFFLIIVISEISAIPFIFKKPKIGAWLGMFAAILNILQIIADQSHLMQPEAASVGYLILEDAVGVMSVALAYFSWKIIILGQKTAP